MFMGWNWPAQQWKRKNEALGMASPWAKPRSGGEAHAGRLWRGIRLALALDAVNASVRPLLDSNEAE